MLPEFKDDEDQEFARRLFRRTILNGDYYRHLISDNTRNWDLDRVAFMDVVIMQCALAEIGLIADLGGDFGKGVHTVIPFYLAMRFKWRLMRCSSCFSAALARASAR